LYSPLLLCFSSQKPTRRRKNYAPPRSSSLFRSGGMLPPRFLSFRTGTVFTPSPFLSFCFDRGARCPPFPFVLNGDSDSHRPHVFLSVSIRGHAAPRFLLFRTGTHESRPHFWCFDRGAVRCIPFPFVSNGGGVNPTCRPCFFSFTHQ